MKNIELDADGIKQWVMNDQGLYNWFQEDRPRDRFFEDDPAGEIEQEDLAAFVKENRVELEKWILKSFSARQP